MLRGSSGAAFTPAGPWLGPEVGLKVNTTPWAPAVAFAVKTAVVSTSPEPDRKRIWSVAKYCAAVWATVRPGAARPYAVPVEVSEQFDPSVPPEMSVALMGSTLPLTAIIFRVSKQEAVYCRVFAL